VAGLYAHPRGVDDPAVAVQLVLLGRAVAHPHRYAAVVPRPVGQAAFCRDSPTVKSEQRLQAGPLQTAGVQHPPGNPRASASLPAPRKAATPILASRGHA